MREVITFLSILVVLSTIPAAQGDKWVQQLLDSSAACPDYSSWSFSKHEPYSTGRHELSYQRPELRCRKFRVREVEHAIKEMRDVIRDPDLFRLFENCFPNTLDTAVTWKGLAALEAGTNREEVCNCRTGLCSRPMSRHESRGRK
jgi:hypothetical protein